MNMDHDEELVGLFEEAAESAYVTILSQHPEEEFYIFLFHFDQKLHARVSTFSIQALERACEEQEITDEQEKRWYRIGGCAALCNAYGYTERLSELDEILDRRAANILGDPLELLKKLTAGIGSIDELGAPEVYEREFNIRLNSAVEAVKRLRNKELFGMDPHCIWIRVGPESLDGILKRIYESKQDDNDFIVMVLCDSDLRNPMMPDWFA